MSSHNQLEVCIVGSGPRGLSVLERLCARRRATPGRADLLIHVVDPTGPGAGAVWRTDQSRHLLMNTVASQITIYTDDSVQITGPIEPGPTLYEWARALGRSASTEGHDLQTVEEARSLGPDDYPTRSLYGQYLTDTFDRIARQAPAGVSVVVHSSRAVAMADTHGIANGPQGVRLENGTRLNTLNAIVLAQGHVPTKLTPREARTASLARIHYLTYLTPGNPADADLSGIAPGETVLVRGLGLNFFDYMALFSAGRGGDFRRDNGRLVYHPSGLEPKLHAFSRRGVPYHARGRNEKGAHGRYLPRLLTPQYIQDLRVRVGDAVNFGRDLWPRISAEVQSVYYAGLLRDRGQDPEPFVQRYLARALAPDTALYRDTDALLMEHGIGAQDRWSWERISRPYGERQFTDRADFHRWLLEYLAQDVREAERGNLSSPLKAALDVLRDLRNEVRLAVDHGGLDGESHRDELDGWYTPLNAFLSIGPPSSRIEEMMALIEAGVLMLIGPGTKVRIDAEEPAFLASSDQVPGPPIRSTVLVEARLPEPDLRRTADPLLRHLLDTEQVSTYRIAATSGDYETGGLAVTERPYHLLDARGRTHPRRFAYGVPTESVHWVTAAGIRPGVDSVTLGDSDAIAEAVLALPTTAHVPAGVRPPVDESELLELVV